MNTSSETYQRNLRAELKQIVRLREEHLRYRQDGFFVGGRDFLERTRRRMVEIRVELARLDKENHDQQ